MATQRDSTDLISDNFAVSAIENEIPTYRAISTRAVLSLLCGLMALFSIANPVFYLFSILAVYLGYTADKNIRRYPDILTGRGLAQAGAALGLIFGLAIFTMTSVQTYIRTRSAESFAKHYANVLKSGTVGDVLWYELPTPQRKTSTPAELELKLNGPKGKDTAMYDMKTASLRKLKQRIDSSPGHDLHFVQIEREGSDGVTSMALALYEVHGPESKESPQSEQHAMAILKSMPSEGKGYDWWVDDLVFPYKPQTGNLPDAPPVDDGHGHAH